MIPSERRLAISRTGVLAGAPLSLAQQRLWFLDQLTPNSSIYNIPLIVDLEGPLDVEAMCRAIREIVRRHDALRTTLPSQRGIPHQVVQSLDAFLVPVDDLSRCDVESRDAEVDAAITEQARRPFDLAQGPIFRMRLLRLGREQHVLVGAAHHLVFDAWSTGIFFRELTTLYRAFCAGEPSPLPDLPVRYVDFAAAGRQRMSTFAMRSDCGTTPITPAISSKRFHRAVTTYEPRPYDGTMTVIRSRTRRLVAFAPMNPDLGWRTLASGGVQTRLVPGAHDTIIREPRVRKLADVLSESLQEVSWPA